MNTQRCEDVKYHHDRGSIAEVTQSPCLGTEANQSTAGNSSATLYAQGGLESALPMPKVKGNAATIGFHSGTHLGLLLFLLGSIPKRQESRTL